MDRVEDPALYNFYFCHVLVFCYFNLYDLFIDLNLLIKHLNVQKMYSYLINNVFYLYFIISYVGFILGVKHYIIIKLKN